MYSHIGRNGRYLLRNIQRGFTQKLSCCERWNIKIIEGKTQAIYFLVDMEGRSRILYWKNGTFPPWAKQNILVQFLEHTENFIEMIKRIPAEH